jgi:hypothetical protein
MLHIRDWEMGWREGKNPQADWADLAQLIGKIGV